MSGVRIKLAARDYLEPVRIVPRSNGKNSQSNRQPYPHQQGEKNASQQRNEGIQKATHYFRLYRKLSLFNIDNYPAIGEKRSDGIEIFHFENDMYLLSGCVGRDGVVYLASVWRVD